MSYKVYMIAACDRNGAIGKDNQLPWHCPQDLKHFAHLTMGKTLVMGRKTAESLGKPLRGRVNLVLTTDHTWHKPGFITCTSIDAVHRHMVCSGVGELWVIGGAGVYQQYIHQADTVHLTWLDLEVPDPDAWFPVEDLDQYLGNHAQTTEDPQVVYWTFERYGFGSSKTMPAHLSADASMELDTRPDGI